MPAISSRSPSLTRRRATRVNNSTAESRSSTSSATGIASSSAIRRRRLVTNVNRPRGWIGLVHSRIDGADVVAAHVDLLGTAARTVVGHESPTEANTGNADVWPQASTPSHDVVCLRREQVGPPAMPNRTPGPSPPPKPIAPAVGGGVHDRPIATWPVARSDPAEHSQSACIVGDGMIVTRHRYFSLQPR
jgi:hypothetical protein